MTEEIHARRDVLPDGVSFEPDGDQVWVLLNGERKVCCANQEAATHQAHLLTAFADKHTPFDLWPELPFWGTIDTAPIPDPVRPRFSWYFDWTYRVPTFHLLIGIDYASWLIWKVVRDTPRYADIARQTSPALAWCFFWLTGQTAIKRYHRRGVSFDRSEGSAIPRHYEKVSAQFIELGTFLRLRAALRRKSK